MAGTTSDIVRWTGAAGDGNPATAGNWIIQAGTPSTPPAAGEKAIVNTLGASQINGANQSALTLGELEIERFPGQIGVGGTPWQINATVLKVNSLSDVNLAGTFTTTTIAGTGAGRVRLASGDCDNLTVSGGDVVIGTAFTVAQNATELVRVLGGNVRIEANANAVVEIIQQGGYVTSERSVTTWHADGGVAKPRLNAAVTTLNGRGMARVLIETSGTLATVNAFRCEINDLSSPFPTTITTLNEFQTTSNVRLRNRNAAIGTDNLIGEPGGSGGLGA